MDHYLKSMMEKIHKQEVNEANARDEMFREKQLRDLRKKLVQYSK